MLSSSERPLNELTGRVYLPSQLNGADLERWRSLAATGVRSAFLTPAFALAASRTRDVRVGVLTSGGEAVAFFPFQFRSTFHRILRLAERVAGNLSDGFGIVAAQSVRLTPGQLLQLFGLQAVSFTHLYASQSFHGLRAAEEEPGLVIELANGPEAFWAELRARDAKFVSDTTRRSRRLTEAHGPLRFAYQTSDTARDLAHLMAMKRGQYARTGARDPLGSPHAAALLRDLAAVRETECCAVLSTLHAGECWVASHFGLRCHGTLHYWLPVYNPDLHAFAPGRLLMKAIIDSSRETGIDLIDRGAGMSQAKQDFANGSRALGRGIWQQAGFRSAGYRLFLSGKWRLRQLAASRRRQTASRS